MTTVDIQPEEAAIVRAILMAAGPRPSRVWVFGSRVAGRARRFSDLDLAIDAHRPLTFAETVALQELFVESALPWRVDVVDVQTASDTFKASIFADAALIAELGEAASILDALK